MNRCKPGEHSWKEDAVGRKVCTTCGQPHCAPGECHPVLHPFPTSIARGTYDALCSHCGSKSEWPLPEATAALPPLEHHTVENYARLAARFGHPPPARVGVTALPVPPCTKCGAPASRYHPQSKLPICDKPACGGGA